MEHKGVVASVLIPGHFSDNFPLNFYTCNDKKYEYELLIHYGHDFALGNWLLFYGE